MPSPKRRGFRGNSNPELLNVRGAITGSAAVVGLMDQNEGADATLDLVLAIQSYTNQRLTTPVASCSRER
jgi:hypothetical protein